MLSYEQVASFVTMMAVLLIKKRYKVMQMYAYIYDVVCFINNVLQGPVQESIKLNIKKLI